MAAFDHSIRLEEDHCTITATEQSMAAERAFATHAVVVSLGMNRPRTAAADVADAFRQAFGIKQSAMQVAPHSPEDFLVYFNDPSHAAETAGRQFRSGGRSFTVLAWSAERHADWTFMPFRVRLCLENVPMQLWNAETAAAIIPHRCALQFVEDRTLYCSDTSTFCLWAWVPSLESVARSVWLTEVQPQAVAAGMPVPAPRIAVSDTPPLKAQEGSVYKILVHLDTVEDLRGLGDPAAAGTSREGELRSRTVDWRMGVPDGTPLAPPTHAQHRGDSREVIRVRRGEEFRRSASRESERRRIQGGRASCRQADVPARRDHDADDEGGQQEDGLAPCPRRVDRQRGHGKARARERTPYRRGEDRGTRRHGGHRARSARRSCPRSSPRLAVAAPPHLLQCIGIRAAARARRQSGHRPPTAGTVMGRRMGCLSRTRRRPPWRWPLLPLGSVRAVGMSLLLLRMCVPVAKVLVTE